MKIEILVNENSEKLSENDFQIFKYIKNNKNNLKEVSCELLANECHVSRATLLRFCRKLNLKSFAELKYLLKSQDDSLYEGNDLDIKEASKTYHKMIDEIKNYKYRDICSLIYNSETIYIYGTGNAQKSEAEEFKRIFLTAGKCVIDLFDLGEVKLAKETFTSNDLFVIISLSGEAVEGIKILNTIEQTAIKSMSITRFENNTIARSCKNNLYVGTKMLHGFENIQYEMTAAFYVLLDILFVNYIEYIRWGKNEY